MTTPALCTFCGEFADDCDCPSTCDRCGEPLDCWGECVRPECALLRDRELSDDRRSDMARGK